MIERCFFGQRWLRRARSPDDRGVAVERGSDEALEVAHAVRVLDALVANTVLEEGAPDASSARACDRAFAGAPQVQDHAGTARFMVALAYKV